MTILPKGADNYFTFVSGDTQYFGLSKGGICYKIGDGGAMTPVAYGDEYLITPGSRVTIRRGQKTFTLDEV